MKTLNPKQFIHSQHYGVLSTHSKTEEGYPFGSISPYIITKEGDIAIFISHLAEHTKNIEANPRVSLTIFDPNDADDPTAGARITCLAVAEEHNKEDVSLRNSYLKRFPMSAITLELPGFSFYVLKLTKIRLVAGFGEIQWLSPSQLQL
jgi:putative heme iron utilization protein